MSSYCLKCRKEDKVKIQRLQRQIKKKLRFIKEEEASELLSSVGIQTPSS